MSLTEEAIAIIQETAVDAAGVKLLQIPAEPDHVYAMTQGGKDPVIRVAEPKPRNHRLADLAAVLHFCRLHSKPDKQMVVWVGEQAVTVVLDDATRRDVAVCLLPETPEIMLLSQLGANPDAPAWANQKDFVRLLRVKLSRAFAHDPELWLKFKNVAAATNRQTTGALEHGSAAMSRAVQAQITGAASLPESVTAKTRVFDIRQTSELEIACHVEIDPEEMRFALTPRAGALAEARLAARTEVADYFTSNLSDLTKIAVLMGAPSAGR